MTNNIVGKISSNNGFSDASLKLQIGSSSVIVFPNNSFLKRNLISNNGNLDLEINSNGKFSITSEIPPFVFMSLMISGKIREI